MHSENIGKIVIECQDWSDKNCLYLGPEARTAFIKAYNLAYMHKDLLNGRSNRDDPTPIQENWKDITDVGNIIVKSAELPPLGELEEKIIGKENSSPKK